MMPPSGALDAPSPPRFSPVVDRAFAHGTHLVALAGEDPAVAPAYARGDARLRGDPATRSPPPTAAALPSLEGLIGGAASPALDAAWFERRWQAGEASACLAAAERIAREAADTASGGLLDRVDVRVVVATPLRTETAIGARRDEATPTLSVTVACGLETPGALAVLAAIAARLPDEPRLAEVLDVDGVRRVRLHMAGCALALALGDDPAIEPILARAAEVLLPPQHQGDRTIGLVARLARAGLLDQPPGEIERLGKGLARRYPDRLHRAWRRGFFVLRGGDLAAWVAALRGT